MAIGFLMNGAALPAWWIVGALAVVAGVAERQSTRLFRTGEGAVEVSVSFLPFVFTAVAFGPFAGFLVGALANLTDFRRPYLRWVVYTPARALTGAAAGGAAGMFAVSHGGFTGVLVAALFGALANLVVDAALNITTIRARGTTTAFAYLRAMGPFFFVALPLYVPVVALLVYAYDRYSLIAVVTFLVPAVALQRVINLYQEQRDATHRLSDANDRLERANLSFAAALVATLDARDRYTAGHSAAVAIYSRDIAAQLGLPEASQQSAHLAGLVHDIGKIGLPPGLLEKEGPLTLEERRVMQMHSEIGERILANVDDYSQIADIVRHHHERVDGHGYPDGRVGDEIPLIARIISVADAYNAMTSDRPYREAMPSPVARLRLAQAVGSQFDISVVAAFEAILATADEAYRMGRRSDFDLSREPALASSRAYMDVAAMDVA
jgi:putative nucleotidyltransferase with HDIG domain